MPTVAAAVALLGPNTARQHHNNLWHIIMTFDKWYTTSWYNTCIIPSIWDPSAGQRTQLGPAACNQAAYRLETATQRVDWQLSLVLPHGRLSSAYRAVDGMGDRCDAATVQMSPW